MSEFLPSIAPPDRSMQRDLLVRLLDDQSQLWRQGKGVAVEEYLGRYPDLARDSDLALDLIYNEVVQRQRCGEHPTPDDYLRRFPQFEGQLRAQFEVHSALEGDSDDDVLGFAGVPGYEILGELGHGGMGIVYKARQIGLNRVVALKMILGGRRVGSEALARFRTEGKAIARLQHPHIVQVYEVGEYAGQPYFTLEYCAGGSLAHALAGSPLVPCEAARLVELLARAMQVAHDAGVIHRDLKPANVLLGGERRVANGEKEEPSSLATPKISDFGLAKQLDEADQTQSGAVMGTPSYMAPEQAAGKAKEVGPACDIHALGAILYEALTGRPPFEGATVMETLHLVCTREPAPPSRLRPGVSRDLDTVCLKCLRKEPAKRYSTAGELADDLRRYLNGEPLRARPVGRLERTAKWVRRNPVVAALLATVAILLVGGVAGITFALFKAMDESHQKDRALSEKDRALGEAEDAIALKNIQLAQAIWQEPNALMGRLKLEEIPEHRRGWDWRYLRRAFDGSLYTIPSFSQERVPIELLAFHPGGGLIAWSNEDCKIILSDTRTGQEVRTLSLREPSNTTMGYMIADLVFHPDGTEMAVAHLGRKEHEVVHFWEPTSGTYRGNLAVPKGVVRCLAYGPGGKLVAAGQRHSGAANQIAEVWVWDRASGRLLHTFRRHPREIKHVAFSPDGRYLASAGGDASARVWDLRTGKPVFSCKGEGDEMIAVAFSPESRLLATRDSGGHVWLWDMAERKPIASLPGLSRTMASEQKGLAFSPDGQLLAGANLDGTIVLWDTVRHHVVRTLIGHGREVQRLAFSPDGHLLISAGGDHCVKLWDVRERTPAVRLAQAPRDLKSFACAPDGRNLAVGAKGWVELWDGYTGRMLHTIPLAARSWSSLAFSRDSRNLVATDGSRAEILHADTGERLREIKLAGAELFSPRFAGIEGNRLLVVANRAKKGSEVQLWDINEREPLRTLAVPEKVGGILAVSTDGRWAAVPTASEKVRLWDVETGTEGEPLECPGGAMAMDFSPDGRVLAVGASDGTVTLWDLLSRTKLLRFIGHNQGIFDLHFGADGLCLATTGQDEVVNVWDARTGQRLIGLPLGETGLRGVHFTRDGLRLLALSNQHIIAWDAEALSERRTLYGPMASSTTDAFFNPDGTLLAAVDDDENVYIWDTRTGKNRRVMNNGKESAVYRFSEDGQTIERCNPRNRDRIWIRETGETVPLEKSKQAHSNSTISPDGKTAAVIDGPLVHLVSSGPLSEREEGRRRLMTAPDLIWHAREAALAERGGRWFAAAFHRHRLALHEPWNPLAWDKHAHACTRAGLRELAVLSLLRAHLR